MQTNNMAMRETLEMMISLIDKGVICTSYANTPEEMEQIEEFYRKVKAALSAPPRNCDMPLVVDGPADNNADKAWLVFKRHNPDAYFDAPGLLRCIDWLLAPATEQKGETDAK